MYVGHFAIALAAKGRRPSLPLVACLIAAMAPDLMMAVVGIATGGAPADAYSHSLAAVAVLAFIGWGGARIYLPASRDALWVVVLVVSHLPADWVTSRLALWPHGPVWGAGLYSRPGIDLAIESVLAVAGWAIYRRSLPRERRRATLAWAPLGVLLVLQGVWFWMSWR